ncbi:hypothetical protein BaRGS_00010508 [Batillaria attramentaria]|uniref:Uncharacterized protein n=1 Tax=Batillaria attramentaria TaxID=370345 RepID=A0ABD0LFQ3_9CAEN
MRRLWLEKTGGYSGRVFRGEAEGVDGRGGETRQGGENSGPLQARLPLMSGPCSSCVGHFYSGTAVISSTCTKRKTLGSLLVLPPVVTLPK